MVLAYSPMLHIANSSIPFRAYLGALLSIVKGLPVAPPIFSIDNILETLPEADQDMDDDSFPNSNGEDGSGTYKTPPPIHP